MVGVNSYNSWTGISTIMSDYGQLVALSCMDKPRNKGEISSIWGLSKQGGMLYQEKASEQVQNLVDDGLIDKNGNALSFRLSGDAFSVILEDIVQDIDSKLFENEKVLSENYRELKMTLDSGNIRENFLEPEIVKGYYIDVSRLREGGIQSFFRSIILVSLIHALHDLSDDADKQNLRKFLLIQREAFKQIPHYNNQVIFDKVEDNPGNLFQMRLEEIMKTEFLN